MSGKSKGRTIYVMHIKVQNLQMAKFSGRHLTQVSQIRLINSSHEIKGICKCL